MSETDALLARYLAFSPHELQDQWLAVLARSWPAPGHRQVPFTPLETVLCYGLFFVLDPHRYGGANIHQAPSILHTLAALFHRTPGSLTSKMLNLDGSRSHSVREEPLLFALFAAEPTRYTSLYRTILMTARQIGLNEATLPDFLAEVIDEAGTLLGQEELAASSNHLLREAENEMEQLAETFALDDHVTEALVEQKIRLVQHRFAQAVLANCGHTCVFCGFAPHSLPAHHGLLRASHIKPWAVSDGRERMDVHNGLAACPIHDAAFDQGYLTITQQLHIQRSPLLETSRRWDQQVEAYFGAVLHPLLLLPPHAIRPSTAYLRYHQQQIFKQ